MTFENEVALLDDILSEWQDLIGPEYQGYRNHCARMLNFCLALRDCSEAERHQLVIAAAFHDIGIWIEETVDYIPPSIPPALAYLRREGLEQWADEIELMIAEHHKVRAYRDPAHPLVEVFRRGDLVDFSLGLVKFGLPRALIDEVKARYPNADFHKNLGKRARRWCLKHPFNPAPMMKW